MFLFSTSTRHLATLLWVGGLLAGCNVEIDVSHEVSFHFEAGSLMGTVKTVIVPGVKDAPLMELNAGSLECRLFDPLSSTITVLGVEGPTPMTVTLQDDSGRAAVCALSAGKLVRFDTCTVDDGFLAIPEHVFDSGDRSGFSLQASLTAAGVIVLPDAVVVEVEIGLDYL